MAVMVMENLHVCVCQGIRTSASAEERPGFQRHSRVTVLEADEGSRIIKQQAELKQQIAAGKQHLPSCWT
jgi:hypothetical protein